MVQGIASQILSESPSQQAAPVSANTQESTEQTGQPGQENQSAANDFDSRFSVLTKMERKIKEAEARNREMEKGWGEKEKKLTEYEELMKLADENPLEFMKRKKGWGIQELNEFAVQHSSDEDLDPVAKITKNFTSKMEEMEKAWEEKLAKKIAEKEEEINSKTRDHQVAEFKGNLKSFLAENKDSYEFIHAEEGATDEVFNLIYEDVQRQIADGKDSESIKIMDMKDAADKVEAFLDKQYSKYLSLNKVKSKFNSSNDDLGRFIAKSQEPTTLNSSFSPKSKPLDQLSSEERKQQAIAFMRSQKT